jgi:hypothetical protein
VEPALQRDELVFTRVELGQLQRSFNSLSTTTAKEAFLELPGSDASEFFGEISRGPVVVDVRAAVNKLAHLCFGRIQDQRIAVPGIHYGYSGEAVNVVATAFILNHCTMGGGDDNRLDAL